MDDFGIVKKKKRTEKEKTVTGRPDICQVYGRPWEPSSC